MDRAMQRGTFLGHFWIILVLAAVPSLGRTARAQAPREAPLVLPQEATDPVRSPFSPPDLRLNFSSFFQDSISTTYRPDRFQLFRMTTGFLITPVGLDSDDDDPVNESAL